MTSQRRQKTMLTADQIVAIYDGKSDGLGLRAIAMKVGVSESVAWAALRRVEDFLLEPDTIPSFVSYRVAVRRIRAREEHVLQPMALDAEASAVNRPVSTEHAFKHIEIKADLPIILWRMLKDILVKTPGGTELWNTLEQQNAQWKIEDTNS